jgi:hypothetical protein
MFCRTSNAMRGLASTVTIITLEQVTFETADHKEATMSFKEKRKPVFGQR